MTGKLGHVTLNQGWYSNLTDECLRARGPAACARLKLILFSVPAAFSLLLQVSPELQRRVVSCPGFLHTAVLSYIGLLQTYLDGLELGAAGQLSNNQVTGHSNGGSFDTRDFLLRRYLNCRWSLFTFWVRPNGFFSEWSHKHLLRLSPPTSSHRWPTSTLYTSALLKSADHSVLSLGPADVWMQRGGPGCGCSSFGAPRPPQPQPTDELPLSNWRLLSCSHLITVPIIGPVEV